MLWKIQARMNKKLRLQIESWIKKIGESKHAAWTDFFYANPVLYIRPYGIKLQLLTHPGNRNVELFTVFGYRPSGNFITLVIEDLG